MIVGGYILADDYGDVIGLTLDDARAVVTAIDADDVQQDADPGHILHLWRGRAGRLYVCRDGLVVGISDDDVSGLRAIIGGVS